MFMVEGNDDFNGSKINRILLPESPSAVLEGWMRTHFRGSITEWTHRKHSIGVIVGFSRIQTKNLSSWQNWMDQNGIQQDAQIM